MKTWKCYGNCRHECCELKCDDNVEPSGCIHSITADDSEDCYTEWVEK